MPDSVVVAGDKWAKKIEAGFKDWVESLGDKKPKDWGVFNLEPYIRGAVLDGLGIAADQIGQMGIGIAFNLRNPLTEAWIKQYSAQEIKYISDSSKDAIKQIILRGQEEGITSQEQARMIREHIGLDTRRSTALANYEEQLQKAGFGPAEVAKQVGKYRQKLINDRAEVIALTEGHTAANEGYRQGNAEAVKRGVLDPNEWERYWMVTHDKRTCHICNGLSGNAASLPDGTFEGDGRGPPKHPRCRCTEGLRRTGRISQNQKPALNDSEFDSKTVIASIKSGTLSQGDLQLHITHTKYEIDQIRAQLDTMLENRGKTKASDIRATDKFMRLAEKRDVMKSNLGKMYDAMKATSNVKRLGYR